MTCRIFVEAASDAALLHTLLADLDPDPSRLFRVIAAGVLTPHVQWRARPN
jgi:hypothetical protein